MVPFLGISLSNIFRVQAPGGARVRGPARTQALLSHVSVGNGVSRGKYGSSLEYSTKIDRNLQIAGQGWPRAGGPLSGGGSGSRVVETGPSLFLKVRVSGGER